MKEDFTQYDVKPEGFVNYLRYYGPHFNRKLCQFACDQMPRIEYSKDKLDSLLLSKGITLKDSKLYDGVYVANWCRNIFYGSGILDEDHLLLFLQDIFNKEGDLIFNRWYADMAKLGIPIEWETMI